LKKCAQMYAKDGIAKAKATITVRKHPRECSEMRFLMSKAKRTPVTTAGGIWLSTFDKDLEENSGDDSWGVII
jgi:hypothetical protein